MSNIGLNRVFVRRSGFALQLLCAALLYFGLPATGAQSDPAGEPVFVLSPGDTVELKFFNNPDFNDTLQIRPDGMVSLPVIGEVKLAGRTIPEVVSEIKERYAPTLAKPDVSMNVKLYARRKVFVSGEVNRPGSIAIPGNMSIFEAIVEAGGIKPTGSRKTVYLLRRGKDGNPTMQGVSLEVPNGKPGSQQATNPSKDLLASITPLEPFDVVIVPESGVSKANRWIDQHIRQMIPVFLSAGFSYLFNPIAVR